MPDTSNIEVIRFGKASGNVLGTITVSAEIRGKNVVIGNALILDHASPDISLTKLAGAIRGKLSVDDLRAISVAISEFANTVQQVHETEPFAS